LCTCSCCYVLDVDVVDNVVDNVVDDVVVVVVCEVLVAGSNLIDPRAEVGLPVPVL
jgi:hypothetical protein